MGDIFRSMTKIENITPEEFDRLKTQQDAGPCSLFYEWGDLRLSHEMLNPYLGNTKDWFVYRHNSWPHLEEVYRPVPYFSSSQLVRLEDLNSAHRWLCVDGLTNLACFFKKNGSPLGLKGSLLVGVEAKNMIPRSWHERVMFYRLKTVNLHMTMNSRAVVLISLGDDDSAIFEASKKLSELVQTQAFEQYDSVRIHITTFGGLRGGKRGFCSFFEKICHLIGEKYQLISLDEILSSRNFKGVDLINLIDKNVTLDSFLVHYVCSYGASKGDDIIIEDNISLFERLNINSHYFYEIYK